MNTTSLVLTILGDDRPGLVESIARLVAAHQGNWVESRMAHLAGKFAGILRVEIDAQRADQLTIALGALADQGIESLVHPDPTASADASADKLPLVRLDLVGQDRAGIVREVSRVLAELHVNVEELSTECVAAPNSGQSLFRAIAKLRLPPGLNEYDLRQALEEVAHDLMVDVTLGG